MPQLDPPCQLPYFKANVAKRSLLSLVQLRASFIAPFEHEHEHEDD
jgi:hypothetical protein